MRRSLGIYLFLAVIAILVLLVGRPVLADELYVDDDPGCGGNSPCYSTIQAAIDDAAPGDTVLVEDGTYTGIGNKNIDFQGKAITVRSQNGPTVCTIDCGGIGRGFYFQNGEGAGSVLSGFTITNGSADHGGGIYCDSASPMITNCRFISNTANFYGGGIRCNNGSSPGIADCAFESNTAKYGAAIACTSSSPTISNCTLETNAADYFGGGIYCDSASPEITGCTLNANTAVRYGGGIYCEASSSPNVSDCTISNNTATSSIFGGGGGVYSTSSSPSISDSTINNNTAEKSGGGLYGDDSPLTITNCNISMNTATSNRGGGIYFFFNEPTISGSTISDNRAYDGGGIFCESSSPRVYTTTISGNTAERSAGGIYCDLSYASFGTCTISNNTAVYEGGVRLSGGSHVILANCVISNNTADYGAGIGIYSSPSNIINCTVTKNTATIEGGGLRLVSSTLRPAVINTILWADAPDEIKVVSGPILFEYCNIQGGYAGTGNIDTNPAFVDPASDNFHLGALSGCIDAATSDSAPEVDFDGTARYDDQATPDTGSGDITYYDIGAYEYYPVCEGDFDTDGDADGSDLAILIDSGGADIDIFAEDFGRMDCPQR
jgi:parallel beta-helix repeat protein/predicted outer membrane repeat protein